MQRTIATTSHVQRLTHIVKHMTGWAHTIPALLTSALRSQSVRDLAALTQTHSSMMAYAAEYNDTIRVIFQSSLCPTMCATHLVSLLDAFAAHGAPELVEGLMEVVESWHAEAQTDLLVLSQILSCCKMLRLDSSTWPPLVKVCPALCAALHKFVKWVHRNAFPSNETNAVITLVRRCLTRCSKDRVLLPPGMVCDVLAAAASAYDRLLHPRHNVSQDIAINLINLLLFRKDLSEAIIRDSTTTAHLIAKLAFVAVSCCEELLPQSSVKRFFSTVHLIRVPSRAEAAHTRFTDATIIRSLHEVSVRYPSLSRDCTRFLNYLPARTQPLSDVDVAAIQGMLTHCVVHSTRLLLMSVSMCPRPSLKERAEARFLLLAAFSDIGNAITQMKGFEEVEGLSMTTLGNMLDRLSMPGTLIALEALLRDVQLRTPMRSATPLLAVFIRTAYIITDIITYLPTCAVPHRQLLSLNSTLLKLMRFQLALPLGGHACRLPGQLLSILSCVTAMADRIRSQTRVDRDFHRLYMVLCWAVVPVLTTLQKAEISVSGTPHAEMVLADILETLRPGYLECFAELHSGELLCFCSFLGCGNLEGVSEATLPTTLCSGCRRKRYCSVKCQHADWLSGHARVCGV